jgi:hypothetical protein
MEKCMVCKEEECDILIQRTGHYHKDCLNEYDLSCLNVRDEIETDQESTDQEKDTDCLICNMECDTLLPNGGYCHEECLMEWFDENKLNKINDNLYEFTSEYDSDLNILSENDIKCIDIAYKRQEIDKIFREVNHSYSKKAYDIFKYMLNNNMIIKNIKNIKSDQEKLKNHYLINNEECKIRDECIGHKSSYRTGRCGGNRCDDCGGYMGGCMSKFEHCCCYDLIEK